VYTAKTHTTGGRDGGASRTSDGRLDVKLSLPGGPGTGTNPEQLLAVGWSACFLSAIKIEAAKMKVRPADVAKAPLEPFSFDPGPLGPEELEIEVTHCGICHSDLSMLDNGVTKCN
jgi:hypothetical protein